ncbi:glycosyltransferase family 4 protein [Salinibacter ruber]|uniref:glycosyltransferase family 4 protein n=1 Tax=Salinibacter ruber TaxID=146919 RepID=UPI00216903CE|nr:glycosyltransferase family 4 protein [Salinibacter ruber]MCS3655573.1 glycosyltransferase involved in cell wall biosynthesis [Salinibacter ruber]MCS4116731.1 glycosyltransferase involved in cell wall biosynthesis [Salinibacter ruber]MCS4152850.1 glycosyltransferase involved in cell wall biosynthesis [Salinibacter ruber]MCS4185435.1 glycosyltransferase involved in cell wall biosynthesis [Salinibacter ruber]
MDILIVNTLYAPYQVGGAERSVQLLAEGLSGHGHNVVVACTKPEKGVETQVVNGVRVYYIGLKNLYWQLDEETKQTWLKPFWHALDSFNPFMQREVEAVIEAEDPDLVHTHNLGGFSVTAWRAAREASRPIVHTLRDYSLLCPRNMFRGGENCARQCGICRPFAEPRNRLSHNVDAVVGISDFVLDRHQSFGYFSNARLHTVIHNPYVLSDEVEGEHSAPATPPNFGFLGRLSPMKGIERVLQAIEAVEDPPDLFIGGTGDEDYVESLHADYDGSAAHFLGFVDPTAFFSDVDVLVVPSVWHEPFGRVVIEAYGHGVPVIAADRGGLSEIVEEGETGFIFDPDTPGSLRRCIEELIETPDRIVEMSHKVRKQADDFALDRHVEQYIEVYDQVKRGSKRTSVSGSQSSE